MLKKTILSLIVTLSLMTGCSSTTSQLQPICPPIEYPVIEAELLQYPEELTQVTSNDPKEIIKVVVENNRQLVDDRTRLVQLINKIRAIQE